MTKSNLIRTIDFIKISFVLCKVNYIFISCSSQLFHQHENIPFVDGDSTVVSIFNYLCPVQ